MKTAPLTINIPLDLLEVLIEKSKLKGQNINVGQVAQDYILKGLESERMENQNKQ